MHTFKNQLVTVKNNDLSLDKSPSLKLVHSSEQDTTKLKQKCKTTITVIINMRMSCRKLKNLLAIDYGIKPRLYRVVLQCEIYY